MKFFQSTIGLKIMMALSGLVLIGFVIGHMLGNLQIFLGADVLNHYAESLHSSPPLIWGARTVLLFSVAVHIKSAVSLTLRSKAARPASYSSHGWLGASYASRTMRMGGFILLAFIVYHLLHFTIMPESFGGKIPCSHEGVEVICENVFSNVVNGFKNPINAIFYIIAQVFLGLHLTHGIHSMARTLGVSNPLSTQRAEKAAVATGIAITVGNCSVPLAVLLGLIG